VGGTQGSTVLLVGDSFTGNYRFAEGDRLQDLLADQLPSPWAARNFAWPGARTLDILMQFHKAETLVGDVERVVLPLFVTKFNVGSNYIRLDKRGDTLKWLPWGEDFGRVYERLSTAERKALLIHQMGLLVGFYDLVEYLYVEHLQSPNERAVMRRDPAHRRARINAKNARRAANWDTYAGDVATVNESQAARDLELLVDTLAARQIPLLIIWLPVGNMDLVRETFTPRAQANLEAMRRQAHAWTKARGVETVDLVDRLPGAYYDDFTHLNQVAGNQVLVDAIKDWIATPAPPGLRP